MPSSPFDTPLSKSKAANNSSQDVAVMTDTHEPTSFNPETFKTVVSLVKIKTFRLDELNNQIKEVNESLKNIIINDSQLSETEENAKNAALTVKKRKQELMNQPESQSLKIKLVELKEELQDTEESLSTQLLSLYQMTGVKEFETDNGEVREFVIKAKVKSKRRKE